LIARAFRALLAYQVVRHAVVLANHVRVARYLDAPAPYSDGGAAHIGCAVVLPLLDEEATIPCAVAHFRTLLRPGRDRLLLVTNEREAGGKASGTSRAAADRADGEVIIHLHAPDPTGLKGDQVNVAARFLADLVPRSDHGRQLVVIYDADSRPSATSLREFAAAAALEPSTPVFHQSAVFQPRDTGAPPLTRALAEGAAMRANRYVVSYEIPRLLSRSSSAGALRSRAARWTFGHVTGHGLGLRLDWLLARPLPSRTPMEDLVYSFDLAVDRVPVRALRSLDRSDVPVSPAEQHRQSERWFRGPSSVLSFRRIAGRCGEPCTAVTVSALLICLEWLSCAVAPPILLWAARAPEPSIRRLARAFMLLVVAETASAESILAPRRPLARRIAAVAMFVPASVAFGAAGWTSLVKAAASVPLQVTTRHAGRN
jgi:hypothetical protein